jgi:hypothetical protein
MKEHSYTSHVQTDADGRALAIDQEARESIKLLTEIVVSLQKQIISLVEAIQKGE